MSVAIGIGDIRHIMVETDGYKNGGQGNFGLDIIFRILCFVCVYLYNLD